MTKWVQKGGLEVQDVSAGWLLRWSEWKEGKTETESRPDVKGYDPERGEGFHWVEPK